MLRTSASLAERLVFACSWRNLLTGQFLAELGRARRIRALQVGKILPSLHLELMEGGLHLTQRLGELRDQAIFVLSGYYRLDDDLASDKHRR